MYCRPPAAFFSRDIQPLASAQLRGSILASWSVPCFAVVAAFDSAGGQLGVAEVVLGQAHPRPADWLDQPQQRTPGAGGGGPVERSAVVVVTMGREQEVGGYFAANLAHPSATYERCKAAGLNGAATIHPVSPQLTTADSCITGTR